MNSHPIPGSSLEIIIKKKKNPCITSFCQEVAVSHKNWEVILSFHCLDSHLSDTSTTESRTMEEQEGE